MLVFSEGACQARAVLLEVAPGSLGALLAGRHCAVKGWFALGHRPAREGAGIRGTLLLFPGSLAREAPGPGKPAQPRPPAHRPRERRCLL